MVNGEKRCFKTSNAKQMPIAEMKLDFVCLVASVFAARYHGRPKLKLIFIKFNQQFLKCVLKSSKLEFGAMSNGGPIENISTYSIQILEKEIWLIKSIND